jgi:hypothetical protein
MTAIPARCELCKHAEHTERPATLTCGRIVFEMNDRRTSKAMIEMGGYFDEIPVLAVAPDFCCALFEPKA